MTWVLKNCLILISGACLFWGCSSPTKFEDKNNIGPSPVVENIKRELASESPLSQSCHEIVEEILYIKEQERVKKSTQKKTPKN